MVGLAVKQGSDAHGHFYSRSSLPTKALPTEVLAISGLAMLIGCTVLVLQLVLKFCRLSKTNLRLEAIVVARLLLHLRLLLLLEPV